VRRFAVQVSIRRRNQTLYPIVTIPQNGSRQFDVRPDETGPLRFGTGCVLLVLAASDSTALIVKKRASIVPPTAASSE
jgi:hypothetical protein